MTHRIRMARKRLAIARERAKKALAVYYAKPRPQRTKCAYERKERRMEQAWAIVMRRDKIA